jgi:hypothetical protein
VKPAITYIGQVDTGKGILIKLSNPAAIARSQGNMAALAQGLAPATIESKVYDGARDEISKSLKLKGIDADVTVVQSGAFHPADGSHVWTDLAFAIGGAGIIGIFWWLASRGRK